MNLKRVWRIFIKDLALGPRSPLLVFMIVIPVLMTLVLNLVFGNLATRLPMLALYVEGTSPFAEEVSGLAGIRVSQVPSEQELFAKVKTHDFDAGLIVPLGFDAAIRSGSKPELQLYFSGESYALDRMVLAVAAIDAVRTVEGSSPPLAVELVQLERGDPIPLSTRFIPVLVLYAFMIAGLFVPASLMVDEKEKRTLVALLTTPAKIHEVVLAKGLLGIVLAFVLATVTLFINKVVISDIAALGLSLLISALFWAVLGVLIGLISRSSEMLFAIVKGAGILMMGPVIFYIFPDWPQWIARLIPTFWAIDPLWQLVANDARLADVALPLLIVLAMCLAALPLIAWLGNRVQRNLA